MESSILKFGVLRPINPEELELMLAWRNAPSVRANMYTRHEISLAEHLAWWSRIQGRSDQKYFMYEFQGAPLGIVAFTGIDRTNQNSSWAFYASPQAQKGTGSKMEFVALEYAFRNIQLHKLCCEVLAFNTPVIKLHQKFGFKVEGVLREQHMVDEAFVDIYRLGVLASEWAVQREEMLHKLLKLSSL
ncbi:UDP-4-amino-4,6-dideoxy-N-acetyl-beta-L-altrosamine N-acetyltransferase [Stutzerimonas kirkiae]|uniref:UDP-4-amino-4, 6-dideoxy-N-acetyl-beta-L-altrosamine N-acetyltransferase n=2 Tax=Stutzerimonas kirkiae TaxID=2211392 RepID=A0A4Q9R1C5_9GAMM|nr:UDP-4-amino-4,6-dideoxy-N-acetyl-beta-L-altrosamine N-acetyltransferase [Stutzerimonas kirkiae]TBU91662.1 UDP-4-amino-4,6-dideoxy-N-acetyl-beta-L-altrosamine N-acetyltransferase [Stutzerimonas kirkiae]TBV00653.1 UDP-4-amino-4,6-dideoxy-N-acetyl-beta-L-altrosamine N-acetyltransferase [Stutzerimonas kirkiae]